MRGRRGFQRGFSAYNYRRELGLGWVLSEAIGRRGRCLGTASWAGSRGTDGSVGGWPVWSRGRRFQSTCRRTVCDAVSWVHHRARRGRRRVGGTLPCRCWFRAGLDGVRAHGNALPALDALGGQLAPRWHGWGVAHARPRAGVARGIVRGCTKGLEGEVTVREAVGAGLLTLGIHGGVSAMSWAAWAVLGRSL
jgi:hypothetical protein